MNKYCASLLLILTCTQASCVNESSTGSTFVELDSPGSSRQIIATSDIEWRVLIQVNSGPAQEFYFSNSDSPMTVNLAGVRRGEQNDISIKWFEILHDHTVEISEQSQSFYANGATLIDTAHRYSQFDYDKDGTPNLEERSAGTCVWSSSERCVNPNQADIPTDNALLNGDFSDGIRYWYSELPALAETSGEYCVFSPATAESRWDARIDYSPLTIFMEANSSYNLVFDVRAQTSSEVFVQMTAKTLDAYKSLLDTSVAASTSFDRKTISYETAEDGHREVLIGFSFGNGTNNTVCFDNIKLIREEL